jgi:PncC family amidohydrolase
LGAVGPVASIVSVGDELLVGQTVDTNSAWLSERLTSLGIPVERRWTVGDSPERIADALAAALDSSQVVVFSGGLGTTPDDRTSDAVRGALGVNSGAGESLENPLGMAPGLAFEANDSVIVLLPGVPRELRAIFTAQVAPRLVSRFGDSRRQSFEHRIHTTGIPEPVLAEQIEEVLGDEMGDGDLAFYPDLRGVDVVLRVRGGTAEAARHLFDAFERRVSGVVGPFRYESPGGDLVEAVAGTLGELGDTLAVAESCTGGLLGKRLTDNGGASRFFRGGVIAYDDSVKRDLLGVSASVLQTEGAVSRAVAEQMARGVALRIGADAGIGITGVAGPGGGTEDKPIGTVWYAVYLNDCVRSEHRTFLGDREAIRERAVQAALALLYHWIMDDQRVMDGQKVAVGPER